MDFYFDNAATTRLSKRAENAWLECSREFFANPSAVHREGRKAKDELERRREECAEILKVKANQIIFTSGATESISDFFSSLIWRESGEILVSKIEHEAVSSFMPVLEHLGWKITYIKAKKGFVTQDEIKEKLNPNVRVVVLMSVNNSTGAIQDVEGAVKTVREYENTIRHKILFFSDSVQALGKIDLNLEKLDVDAASFSSHKINGPRGIGILYLKTPEAFRPLFHAGGQEMGKRGGTENLPAIAGFTEALKESYETREADEFRMSLYKTILMRELESMNIRILSPEKSSPYILTIATPLPSEVFTRLLFDKGFCVSSGSACSNNQKGKAEEKLIAMGIRSELASKAIRISFSRDTEKNEVEALIRAFREIINGQ